MLRISHLTPIAPPAFSSLRLSLTSTLNLSTPLNLHKISTCSALYRLSQTFKPTSPSSSFLSANRVLLRVMGSPGPKGSASFSAESSSGDGREILVQHLLVKEDNLKLLLDLQQRVSRASFSAESSSGDGREILVQHLLVKEDNLKLLLDLQQRVSRGEDLSDLAAEYSICPSKEEGGMLGWVRKGQMVPEFEEAAFSASLNKVVRCKTKFGWHLLQVLSEREESVLQNIQCKELHVKMQDPSFLDEAQLIDVREPEEVAQASLSGFQVLPLRQFGSWGPDITTKFDPQKDTYVMCHHGMRSLQVAQWLQTQGFKRVFNVAGGIHEYARTVDQTIPTY